jgi:ribosomal protein S18 acetylase RimI-like enzyme
VGVTIKRAGADDLDVLVPLFDAYRQFYRQASDPAAARKFLGERIRNNQSVIFAAFVSSAAAGFTQLYPSFSSGLMARIFVLNDLFVVPEARRNGVGVALLNAAADYGRRQGAVRLTLSTELSNATAQALYEKTGWRRDNVFCVYNQSLG